jgi:F420H(2)-dependent quinone reductase
VSALPVRRSATWSAVFRVSYRLIRLFTPLLESWRANGLPGLDGVVELRTVGRRTGTPRRILVTLITVGGSGYVGHPNGHAPWTLNVEAAGWVDVDPSGPSGPRYAVSTLAAGPERDAVIRATWTQQPFPANLLYRAARRHVAAVGVYCRLDPIAQA